MLSRKLQNLTPSAPACWRLSLDTTKRFLSSSDGTDTQEDAPAEQKPKAPDAWKARVPADVAKHGSRLREESPEAFERMRVLLGYYDMPQHKFKRHSKKIDKVYVSNLQTLRYLGFDPAFKIEVVRYKASTLNRELEPVLADTQVLLASLKAGQATSDFVPSIPGMASKESST